MRWESHISGFSTAGLLVYPPTLPRYRPTLRSRHKGERAGGRRRASRAAGSASAAVPTEKFWGTFLWEVPVQVSGLEVGLEAGPGGLEARSGARRRRGRTEYRRSRAMFRHSSSHAHVTRLGAGRRDGGASLQHPVSLSRQLASLNIRHWFKLKRNINISGNIIVVIF